VKSEHTLGAEGIHFPVVPGLGLLVKGTPQSFPAVIENQTFNLVTITL